MGNKKDLHLHHTLRKDLIKDILIWFGVFFSILGVIFILTINSLVDYMLSEMADNRMSYQTVEFAKHLSQNDKKSIDEESHALIQNEALSGMIVIDSSGLIAHVSLHEDDPPSLNISPKMNVVEMRKIIASKSHLRLYEAPIPDHQFTLAIIMDSRPVLKAIYTSTLWTVLLLFTLVGISVLALHYSLRRHLIEPIDEMKHIIDDDLLDERKKDIISHLPDEVASLANTYEDSNKAHEQIEKKLRESEFFLKESQRVANLGSYSLTISTGEWSSSDILDKIFGIDGGYTKNLQGWLDLVHPDDREELNAYLTNNVLLNHEFFNKEYRIIKYSDGSEKWVQGLGKLEFDASNNPIKMVGTIQDITNRKKLETQLNQSQKMEALGALVGVIAHDFNNILAGITGNLYLAKKKAKGNSDILQNLTNVEELSFRAAEMIKQLLIFSRKDMVIMKAILFAPLIKEALKLIRTSIPENIDIHQNICSDELQIRGDSTQLHQVLMNLLNNAHDAVKDVDSPCITIRLEAFQTDDFFMKQHEYFKLGRYAHLSIEDNGCGIPEDQNDHLFKPFYTTKEVGKGTGLGLAMVFGAIKTHGGFVEVESVEEEGSTFHIYIPLLDTEKIAHTPEKKEHVSEGNGETILLVDDEIHLLKTGREVLESLGYQVMEALNGLEAVDLFTAHQNKISLILMDLVMPKLSGVKAVERIREICPDVKVIFSTGYDRDESLPDMAPAGGVPTLSKPYDIAKLSKMIRNQLDS